MASIRKRTSGAWQNTSYGIRATATDTITTLPTTIYGDGTNATVSIYGNTIQNGTPTPDNLIMPEGTGERTGNLVYGRIDNANVFSNGTIVRADGYDIAIGLVESGIVYTINSYVLAFYTDEPTTGSVSYDGSRIVATTGRPTTFTAPITGYVAFRLNSGEQAMLNTGSTALPYEPYGYKIPISSANTTTPVYLGEVETTRKIKKLVLTGEELFTINASGDNTYFAHTLIKPAIRTQSEICTHLPYATIGASNTDVGFSIIANGTELRIRIPNAATTSLADFKSYLAAQYAAGTPVCVWYVLRTEETAVVNEPLMRIGDYADEVSGVSIPTTDGANTLSVDATVQPSEVDVNYHGWHMGTVHEQSSGEWD